MLQKSLSKFIELLFENSCLICRKSSKESLVCNKCENEFTLRKNNYIKQLNGIKVFSWGLYDGRLRAGIISLKASQKKLACYFAKKLAGFWKQTGENKNYKDFLVIPIPSHQKRIKERGYCQVSLIAEEFAKITGLQYANNFVKRTKETSYMNSLKNITERQENIKGAFEINAELPHEKILIIDDIVTSGSTILELARTIKNKYPQAEITGLTVASGDTYDLIATIGP